MALAIAATTPWGEFAYHENTLQELTQIMDDIIWNTADALAKIHGSINSLANIVMDNHLALDYLLAEQVGFAQLIRLALSM